VQLDTPKGLVTATIESLSLGYTLLRDSEGAEIIVPNSVMASSVVVRLGQKNVKA
jgi:small-conductance mechanosensitive channel